MPPRLALLLLSVLLCGGYTTAGAQAAPTPQLLFHGTHEAMGTVFALDLYAPDEQRAGKLMQAAFDEVDRLEALLSNYRL